MSKLLIADKVRLDPARWRDERIGIKDVHDWSAGEWIASGDVAMAKIVFQSHDGKERTIEIANGLSIMEGAVRNGVAGIDADCGGACSCATCMVYVSEEWWDRLPPKDAAEADMLEFSKAAAANSRLSCQIKVTDALDGIRLKTPKNQG